MNKRGNGLAIGFSVIIGLTFFMIGMLFVNFLQPEITRAVGTNGLDCSGNISDGSKLTCLAISIVLPYFFIIIISIAVGKVTWRFIG